MGIGAVAWVLAAATWLAGNPVPSLVPWLAAFLVLTIAGERLELARLIATTAAAKRLLFGAVGVALAGSAIAWASPELGARVAGLGNLLIAVWLIRFDIARRTIRLGGVTRYMAAGLLLGYVWLAVSGVFWMLSGLSAGASTYDAALHTLFLGFVMSMIMAHAPIVIPALAGLAFPFHPSLWVPLILFHVTVVIRVAGGLTGSFEVKKWGAMLNAIVLTLIVLLGTLDTVTLGHAMSHLRVPDKLTHLFLFTVRYLDVLRREYLRLRAAMKTRAFRPRMTGQTCRAYGYLVGMLLVRSYERAERVHRAMLCRGFRGRFHLLSHFALRPVDCIAAAAMLCFVAFLVTIQCGLITLC